MLEIAPVIKPCIIVSYFVFCSDMDARTTLLKAKTNDTTVKLTYAVLSRAGDKRIKENTPHNDAVPPAESDPSFHHSILP